jgi:hypothetical protein
VPRSTVELTEEQKQEVTEKLELAELLFEGVSMEQSPDEMLAVLSEGANNVNNVLQSVLVIDPGNPTALKRQSRIADLYSRKARELTDAGDGKSASQLVNAGLRLRPRNRDLLRLRAELCRQNAAAC